MVVSDSQLNRYPAFTNPNIHEQYVQHVFLTSVVCQQSILTSFYGNSNTFVSLLLIFYPFVFGAHVPWQHLVNHLRMVALSGAFFNNSTVFLLNSKVLFIHFKIPKLRHSECYILMYVELKGLKILYSCSHCLRRLLFIRKFQKFLMK